MLAAFALLLCAAGLAGVILLPRLAGRRLSRAAAAAVVLLPLALFGRGLVTESSYLPADHARQFVPWYPGGFVVPRNPFLQDLTTQFVPWGKLVADSWKSGEVPLRNRWNGCGTPLAANGLSAAFSPLTLCLVLLPLPKAFTLAAIAKLALALAGTWLWLTELSISNRAALFGAVAFALSFAMIPWIFYVQSGVVCLWPWCLFALERLRRARGDRLRGPALLAALFALFLVQGHLESVATGALFAIAFLGLRWALRDLADAPRVFARASLSAAVALAAAAAVLLPQALAILASNRISQVATPYWKPVFSLLPHGPAWKGAFVTALLPRIYGDGIRAPLLLANVSTFPEMAFGCFGVVALAAACLVVRPGSPRRRTEWALLGVAVIGVGIASGTWPFAEIQGSVPLLKYLFPVRVLSWLALAGSAVAAFEVDRLAADVASAADGPGSRRPAVFAAGIAGALAAAAIAVYFAFVPLHRPTRGLASERNGLLLALVFLAGFAALIIWARGGRRMRFLPLGLAALAAVELSWQGLRQYEYVPTKDLCPATPLVRFLTGRPGSFRVVGENAELYPATNVFAGVEDVRTHDAVERADYDRFLDATAGYPPRDYIKFVGNLNAPVLDYLNVRYLVARAGRAAPGEKWRLVYSGADGRVFENREVLPRVFAPAGVVWQRDTGGLSRWVRDAFARFGLPPERLKERRDWTAEAWILGRRNAWEANPPAEVTDYREGTHRVSFRVRAVKPTVLVASLVQDGGWRARDERGTAIPTTLANGPFLALEVPAGEHVVALDYAPPGWRLGFWISAATLAALLLRSVWTRGQS